MYKFIITATLLPIHFSLSHAQTQEASKPLKDEFELRNGLVTLSVIKQGGRIVSFRYMTNEIVTQASEHENFGSTLWLGPQSNWGWPPYQTLDEEKYHAICNSDSITLISEPDTISGFQVTKRIKSDRERNCFVITYLIKNISTVTKQTDAWEVTRVPSGGLSFFPEGEIANLPKSNLKGVTHSQGYYWFQCGQDKFAGGQKLFASASGGWLAHVHQTLLFIKKFKDISSDLLAPQQGEVEIYAHGDRSYIELENHSRYETLLPGKTLKYEVEWYLIPLSSSIKAETGNLELVDFVSQIVNNPKFL